MDIKINNSNVSVTFNKNVKEQMNKDDSLKEKVIATLTNNMEQFSGVESDEFMLVDKNSGYTVVCETMSYGSIVIVTQVIKNNRVFM